MMDTGTEKAIAIKTRIEREGQQQWQKQGCGHDRVRDGHRSRDRGWGHSNSPPWCHKILSTLRPNCLYLWETNDLFVVIVSFLSIRLQLASRMTKAKAGARMGLPLFSSFGDHSSCCLPLPLSCVGENFSYSCKRFQQ